MWGWRCYIVVENVDIGGWVWECTYFWCKYMIFVWMSVSTVSPSTSSWQKQFLVWFILWLFVSLLCYNASFPYCPITLINLCVSHAPPLEITLLPKKLPCTISLPKFHIEDWYSMQFLDPSHLLVFQVACATSYPRHDPFNELHYPCNLHHYPMCVHHDPMENLHNEGGSTIPSIPLHAHFAQY